MKRIVCYQTEDGAIYRTFKEAKRKAEARYADKGSRIAASIAGLKYLELRSYLNGEGVLEEFVELMKLRDDLTLENPEEEEESDDQSGEAKHD